MRADADQRPGSAAGASNASCGPLKPEVRRSAEASTDHAGIAPCDGSVHCIAELTADTGLLLFVPVLDPLQVELGRSTDEER